MHAYAIIHRGGSAVSALSGIVVLKRKCSFFPFEPLLLNAKLNTKRFILFTSVLQFFLQGRNQIAPTASRWRFHLKQYLKTVKTVFSSHLSKQWRVLSWEEFGKVIADQGQNFRTADRADDLKQFTNQCTKTMHERYVANFEFAIAKKNGAHFFGRPDYILGYTRNVALTAISALRTGRQSSDCSYFIRLVISMNCIHSAIFLWITFCVFWLIWCSTAFGCGALRVFASTTLRTRTCEFHALSC